MGQIISRKEAREKGLDRYYTGPCPRGHDSPKYVRDRACVECKRDSSINWRKSNPGRRKEQWASWYARNKESAKALRRARAVANPEQERAWNRAWRAANTSRRGCVQRNREARIRRASGKHTIEDIKKLLNDQGGVCAGPTCSIILTKYHVDHKTPISRGGSNWPRNLQLLCVHCNTSKGAKTKREWFRCLGI